MKKVSTFKVVSWIFIIAFLLISVFPFFWILVTSFKPETEIFGDGAYRIIAQHPTLDAFKTVIFEKNILRAVWNSFVMSGFTTLYVIVVASMSAYIISRFKFKGKNLLMALILTVAMFPQMIIVLFSWKTEFLLGMSGVFIYYSAKCSMDYGGTFQTGSSCTGGGSED